MRVRQVVLLALVFLMSVVGQIQATVSDAGPGPCVGGVCNGVLSCWQTITYCPPSCTSGCHYLNPPPCDGNATTQIPHTEPCNNIGNWCAATLPTENCDPGTVTGSCSWFCPGDPTCGDTDCDTASGENYTNCPADCGSCPTGYTYCGGCINACRSNAQSCATHITNECGTTAPSACSYAGCWCVQAGACPGGWNYGGPGSGWCSAPDGCCCSACDTEGSYWETGPCGGGSCGPCQRQLIKRSNSSGQLCGAEQCVSDPSCAPAGSCTPRCGQANGCSGVCSSSDAGIPGSVTITPANGSTVNISGANQITVSWTAATKADSYTVDIYPTGSDCSSPYASCGISTTSTSRVMTLNGAGGARWTVTVQPVNTSCANQPGLVYDSSFTVLAAVQGAVYLDTGGDAALAGSLCADATRSSIDVAPPAPGEATVGAEGQFSSFSGTMSYGMSFPPKTEFRIYTEWWPSGNTTVTLNPGTDGAGTSYTCSCPVGCRYTGMPAPQTGLDFYLIAADLSHAGWWQAQGGSVTAESDSGTALYSQVPASTCSADPDCSPYLVARDDTAADTSVGPALTGGGAVDTSDEAGNQTSNVADRSPQLLVSGSSTEFRETYDFFFRSFSMGSNPTSEFNGTASDVSKPSSPPANGRAYFYDGGAGDFTIRQAWTVAAGEQLVFFIDGNLRLQDPSDVQQLITVDQGGFLAFIVSGNIVVESSVGNNDSDDTTANIAGFYLADGQIVVESRGAAGGGDDRFVAEGSFVGWSGVTLGRDFDDGGGRKVLNNTVPVELFRYRPDFILNTPERLAVPRYVWQET